MSSSTFLICIFFLLSNVAHITFGQCPVGWQPDGSCTFGNCIQTSEICQKQTNVCCKISQQQNTVQAYRRNPKSNQCELTYCPEGAYKDGGCSVKQFCMDMTETCVNGDCCEKYYLPQYGVTAPVQPCPNTNPYQPGQQPYGQQPYGQQPYGQQPYGQPNYPYGSTPQIIGYSANGQPIYSQPPTYNNNGAYGQPIGYTASGEPVYSYNPLTTNNGYNNQINPYQTNPYQTNPYQTNPYQTNPYQTNPYQTNPYQTNPYQTNPYQTNPYQTNPYQTNPYQTNPYQPNPYQPTPNNGIDPNLLAQACRQGDQSQCSSYAASITTSCGQQTIALSCPNTCQLCTGSTAYGRK